MRLANKSLVIIGGTTGLGLSAAKAFVAEGARVIAVGRNPESVEAARKELGAKAKVIAGDACDAGTASRQRKVGIALELSSTARLALRNPPGPLARRQGTPTAPRRAVPWR